MFGYIRVRQELLTPEEAAGFEAVYCGVCRTMGNHYGAFSRLFLAYDFALLAMLLAPPGVESSTGCRRCLLHPVHGRHACGGGKWLDTAAGESVILTYWKLRDAVSDSPVISGLLPRAMSAGLTPGYHKARAEFPDFDREVIACLEELRGLEDGKCTSIDRTADCFARLLRAAAPATGDAGYDRAISQLLYHLGRWIYLIDAVDDLNEDRAADRYNPIAARFPDWTEEDRTYLRGMLDSSLELAGAAFQLLPSNAWTTIVENILYAGLPGVEELVFTGKWRDYLKKKGGPANERSV